MDNGIPTLGVIGIEHRHIFSQLAHMLKLGCRCKGFWTDGEPQLLADFYKRFADLPRVDSLAALLADEQIDLILLASVPDQRAAHAIAAMRAGKDIMSDKPGCTTLEQLAAIRKTVAATGRIWSINFSERFEVPAVTKAGELVRAGAIGTVVHTVGLGPHRLNRHTRPDWFFQPERYGGILCDIASHQIDQFLFFTGATSAQIVTASFTNLANPADPGLQDFGEILLRTDNARGYIRVDWYTPDALPTWGDGRLTILGTKGYLELRKYVDVAGRAGTDHIFLVNGNRCEHIDASAAPLPYFQALANDVRNRTATAMAQEHCFTVTELALRAQALANAT